MKIAIPVANKKLCAHFGHCQEFIIYEVNNNKVLSKTSIDPPAHAPGVIPEFLAENKVDCILGGGMGSRAQQLFSQFGIKVITGITEADPDAIVNSFINNSLEIGENVCDH